MNDNNCSIGKTYNSVKTEVIMKPKMPQVVSDEKWYEFWVGVLKKTVEKKQERKGWGYHLKREFKEYENY